MLDAVTVLKTFKDGRAIFAAWGAPAGASGGQNRLESRARAP